MRKGQSLAKPVHVLDAPGIEVPVIALDLGVRWLGYNWSPKLAGGVDVIGYEARAADAGDDGECGVPAVSVQRAGMGASEL